MPCVSVIIPLYNALGFIGRAVESVINQTFENWELIIIDDCSDDGSYSFVNEKYSTVDNVYIYRNHHNSGVSKTRNKGISLARGKFVAFLDADDFWDSKKLEVQLSFMTDNDINFSCSSYEVIDLNGNRIGYHEAPFSNDYRGLLKSNTVGCSTVVISSELLKDKKFPNCGHEDYALWLDILFEGNSVFSVNEILSYYTVVPGSLSSNKVRSACYVWYIFRKNRNLSVFESLFYFYFYVINSIGKYR